MSVATVWMNVVRPSLTRRLVLAQLGTLFVIWLILIAYFIYDIAFVDKWYEKQQMRDRAEMIVSVVDAVADRPEQLSSTLQKIDVFQRNENREDDNPGVRMTMNVWRGDQLVFSSAGEPGPMRTSQFDTVETSEQYGLRVRTYAHQSQTSSSRVVFILPSDARSVLITFWSTGVVLLPLLLSMPLLLIPAWISVRVALRPFRKLASEVANKGPHDLAQLNFQAPHRELLPLVGSINDLLTRLREGIARERRFIADAAHELRTPLAAMRINVEALQERAHNASDAQLLDGLVHSGDRATRVVSQLLSLMRSDAVPMRLKSETLALDELVQEQLASLSAIATQRNVELELDVPETPINIRGEREGLLSLVNNILENAIKYSPPGSIVLVTVTADRNGAHFVVTDSGPGIPETIRARVFDRFFRAPDQTLPGSGLGLAIVKSVSDHHGATIQLEDTESGSGLRVRVTFARVMTDERAAK